MSFRVEYVRKSVEKQSDYEGETKEYGLIIVCNPEALE